MTEQEYINSRNELDHSWEDISYHGSPWYQCVFCGCEQFSKVAKMKCLKAEMYIKDFTKRKEEEERQEYAQMIAQRKRFEELHQKYGVK